MFKNNRIVPIILICVSFGVSAQEEITVRESRQLQAKVWKAEQEAKLREAQNRGQTGQAPTVQVVNPSSSAASASQHDDIAFVGHYGIENDLKADFLLNGALVTLSLKGRSEVAGWHLETLTPMFARICKRNSRGKSVNCKDMPLSADRSALTKPQTVTGDMAKGAVVPPIRPVSAGGQ